MIKRGLNIIMGVLAFHAFPSKVRVFLLRLKGVRVGKNTFIGMRVSIDDRNPKQIVIGNNCGIATGVIILAHRRDISDYSINKGYNDYPFVIREVVIGNNVQIGANTVILPGVKIGQGAVIGAGAVVTKEIPPYSLAVGVPAKVVKTFI